MLTLHPSILPILVQVSHEAFTTILCCLVVELVLTLASVDNFDVLGCIAFVIARIDRDTLVLVLVLVELKLQGVLMFLGDGRAALVNEDADASLSDRLLVRQRHFAQARPATLHANIGVIRLHH